MSGNPVLFSESSVPPGGTAHFPVDVCGQGGYARQATLRLQYVKEGVAHFDPIFGMFVTFTRSTGAFEPNDSRAKAYGPLSGGTDYLAEIETDNDEDWYRFYTSRRTQLTITVTNRGDLDACFGPEAYIYGSSSSNAFDEEIVSERQRTGTIHTTVGAGEYALKVSNHFTICENPVSFYALRIDSSAPLTDVSACDSARHRLKSLKRKLVRARSLTRRRALHAKLRRARRRAKELC